ncbi:MAG: hypothetical protein IIB38_05220, partial [Candidatus Hydrogenedentes bacterium]|nr:hypothetical protein [Candidatus Hydrogenedentota bacterium]
MNAVKRAGTQPVGRWNPVRASVSIPLVVLFLTCGTVGAQADDEYRVARESMVRIQIAGSLFGRASVTDEAVLKAMRTVPRHKFVPPAIAGSAYADRPLPIGHAQTIS